MSTRKRKRRANGGTSKRTRTRAPFRRPRMMPVLEKKFNDGLVTNNHPIVTAFTIIPTSGVIQGTGDDERIGQQWVFTSLNFKFSLTPQTTTIDQINKVMIFYDKQSNGLIATLGELFESPNILSHSNLTFRKRFRTLYSSGVFALGGNTSPNVTSSKSWEVNIDTHLPVQGFGATDAATGVITGQILVVLMSTATAVELSHNFSYRRRYRFIETAAIGEAKTFRTSIKHGPSI